MSDHTELCLAPRALGCGPCQLAKGHEPAHRHLCDHYAKGGVELHDPNDRYCRCHDCERMLLVQAIEGAQRAFQQAGDRLEDAFKKLDMHDARWSEEIA